MPLRRAKGNDRPRPSTQKPAKSRFRKKVDEIKEARKTKASKAKNKYYKSNTVGSRR